MNADILVRRISYALSGAQSAHYEADKTLAADSQITGQLAMARRCLNLALKLAQDEAAEVRASVRGEETP